jgi:glycosyltransferase involved in cell wall biosynthesis
VESEKRKVRILFIEETALLGGAQINQLYLQKYLDKSLFDLEVICPSEGPLTDELEKLKSRWSLLPMPRFYSTSLRIGNVQFFNPFAFLCDILLLIPVILSLKKLLRAHQADLVVSNGMLAHFYGGFASRLARTPCVWLVGDIVKPNLAFGFARWIFEKIGTEIPKQIIAVSQAVKNSIRIDSPKVTVIHNGVDLEKYDPSKAQPLLRREYEISQETRTVGILSRLTPWKGHLPFIEAAARVCSKREDTKFFIIGDTLFEKDAYLEELKKKVSDLNLKDKIIFTGFRKDIPECLASLDLCVLPSILPEPFGLVLVEAMAMKKAVIATNLGGAAEVVAHEKTGLLIKPGAEALAQALEKIFSDPGKIKLMGECGRKRAEDFFSVEAFIKKHENIFVRAALKS